MFAKSCFIWAPIYYILLNKNVKKEFREVFCGTNDKNKLTRIETEELRIEEQQ
jgi:hypothetical protein